MNLLDSVIQSILLFKVSRSPGGKLLQNRQQRPPLLGDAVFHLGRNAGINLAGNQLVRLQGFQRAAEHLRRYVGQNPHQFAKPHVRSLAQNQKYQDAPLGTEVRDHVPYRATLHIGKFFNQFFHLFRFDNQYQLPEGKCLTFW